MEIKFEQICKCQPTARRSHEQRPKPPWRDLIGGLTWVTLAKVKPWKKHRRERWRKQTCFAKGPRKLTMIEVYLEPDTSNYKRLFQLDDSNSLHRKRSFNQTSILKLLFRLPGIILVCQIFWGIYRENPRKWGERSAKASRKVQVPSSRVGPFQSQPLILVYFFQLYTASNLDDFKPKGFLFKPKHILKPLSPRKSCERWWCPDTIAKAKMMVAKVSRKVLRKGYMSISQWSLGFDHRSHIFYKYALFILVPFFYLALGFPG